MLALISAGSTIFDAARSAGVHRNTVNNWMNSDPQFRLALGPARESKALFWRERAERLAAAAVDTICALMTETSTRRRPSQSRSVDPRHGDCAAA